METTTRRTGDREAGPVLAFQDVVAVVAMEWVVETRDTTTQRNGYPRGGGGVGCFFLCGGGGLMDAVTSTTRWATGGGGDGVAATRHTSEGGRSTRCGNRQDGRIRCLLLLDRPPSCAPWKEEGCTFRTRPFHRHLSVLVYGDPLSSRNGIWTWCRRPDRLCI